MPRIANLSVAELRERLALSLPDYMLPAAWMLLDSLPLTPNGKVDRRALPAPEGGRLGAGAVYVAPRTALEELLAGVWAEALGVDRVGADDNFFTLGGHSLLATQVVSRIGEMLETEVPLRRLFEAPTVGGLAAGLLSHAPRATRWRRLPGWCSSCSGCRTMRWRRCWCGRPPRVRLRRYREREAGFKLSARRLELLRALRREQGLASNREEAIPRRPEAEGYPLSFNQQRLWFLDRLHPGSAAYNLPVALRLEGPLRGDTLARALAGVVERQTTLRTVFATAAGSAGEEEGAAEQRILAPPEAMAIPLADLGGLPGEARQDEVQRLLRAEALHPFDLERGPLFRFSLLRLGPEDHAVLVTVHHIAADALSLEIFIRELSLLYAGQTLSELPVRYVDYAAWQRAWAGTGGLEEQLAYWRRRLAGAPTVLELPVDRQRPEDARFRVAVEPLTLPAEVAGGLLALARREQVTPFMALFALLAELLRRHTGHDDLLVGSSVANRQRPEVAGLIGFFVNTLVLRAELAG